MPYIFSKGYSSYFSTATTETRNDTMLAVTFGGGDSAALKFSASPDIILAKKIQNSPTEWVLQRRDKIITLESPIPSPVRPRCDTIGVYALKTNTISYYVDLVFNIQRINYLIPGYGLQIINDELNLPLITKAGNSIWNYPTSNGNCTGATWDFPGIKNDNIESNLLARDTIVVQEKNIKMVKVL